MISIPSIRVALEHMPGRGVGIQGACGDAMWEGGAWCDWTRRHLSWCGCSIGTVIEYDVYNARSVDERVVQSADTVSYN